MMQVLIPGLDASLVTDERGVSYWAINADWRPPERLKREAKQKQDKGETGNGGSDGLHQVPIWEDLASW